MQKDIHPEYREVVFYDAGADTKFLTRSTVQTKDTIEYEGQEYPVVRIDISSASHPFYTGKMKYVDSAGRVEKFQKKYKWAERKKGKGKQAAEEQPAEAPAAEGEGGEAAEG